MRELVHHLIEGHVLMREQRVDAGAERRELRRVQRLGRGDAVRRGACAS